jgi:hypothetical protein
MELKPSYEVASCEAIQELPKHYGTSKSNNNTEKK